MNRSLAGVGFVIVVLVAGFACYPVTEFDRVRDEYPVSDAVLLDRHGAVIHELRLDPRARRLAWTRLADIAPGMLEVLVRVEDKRFYEHDGVDWRTFARATHDYLRTGARGGASTITMQVAAQIDPGLKPSGRHRNVWQKARQLIAALAIERSWSKQQILETYVNFAAFRHDIEGINAASRALFEKAPSGLDQRESLLLVSLLRSPSARIDRVADRACGLARRLASEIACETLETLAHASLNAPHRIKPVVALAPHVARRLLKPGMMGAVSTLDADLQRYALETLQRQLQQLGGQNVADGALLVVDNLSGEVLAYVGNSGVMSSAPFVDGVMALRQAGSTLKPFLYELALEQRRLTAASLLDDSPLNLVTSSGLYVPQNYDREFKGLVSVRTSLAASLNVPAVRALMLLGPEAFVTRLRALGFDDVTHEGDYYGYALALGSSEVRLWQLVRAYRVLALGGASASITLTRPHAKVAPAQVMLREAAFITSDIMSDRGARSITFGLDNALGTPFWSAVKTGTSKDMRDNWAVGFSERYTVGVWVGNFSGASMWDVSGVSGAAPIWLDVMNYLNRDAPRHAPPRPTAIEIQDVEFERHVEPARSELFVAGTAVTRVVQRTGTHARARIVYPGNGTIIAFDPDIPSSVQRVRVGIKGNDGTASLRLDGLPLAMRDGVALWQPTGGRHTLTLVGVRGNEEDRVEFEVRGAGS